MLRSAVAVRPPPPHASLHAVPPPAPLSACAAHWQLTHAALFAPTTLSSCRVPPSINEDTGEPTPLGLPRGGGKGQHPKAFNSMTLQLGPLLPNGTTWMDPANSASPQGPLGPGMYLPQDGMKPGGPLGEAAVQLDAAGSRGFVGAVECVSWSPPPAACQPALFPPSPAQRACGRMPRTGRASLQTACCLSCRRSGMKTCSSEPPKERGCRQRPLGLHAPSHVACWALRRHSHILRHPPPCVRSPSLSQQHPARQPGAGQRERDGHAGAAALPGLPQVW